MKVNIQTIVYNSLDKVADQFNEELFLKLAPPLGKLSINKFDGCQKGDVIDLEMTFANMKLKWNGIVTASSRTSDEFYFIDEGVNLPSPLVYWKHTHTVKKISEKQTFIIDDIEFKTRSPLLDKLIYPMIYSMFFMRKAIYQREFNNE